MPEILTLLISLLNKAYMFVFFISTLYTLRHLFLFGMKIKDGQKYEIEPKQVLYLGGAISIILTTIFSGLKLF